MRASHAVIIGIVLILLSVFLIPWDRVNWGTISLLPASTVTVTGEAKSQQTTQIATFTAGVTAINDDKQKAVDEVNQKVEALITSVKEFGIPVEDIKTQNLSVYQQEEPVTVGGRQRSTPGQWRVSNDVMITVRDVAKTAALADLLTASGATNVYGPNFAVDDTQKAEVELVDQAIKNAREKAVAIAAASGQEVGKVITVSESGVSSPIPLYAARDMGGGGGTPIEPGSQTVYKSLTVTFELK